MLQGACLALDAGRWSEYMAQISAFHNLPSPTEVERFPVGTGSNPVSYLYNAVTAFLNIYFFQFVLTLLCVLLVCHRCILWLILQSKFLLREGWKHHFMV